MTQYYKMKAALRSEDGGKSWSVYKIFYVTEAKTEYGQYEFTDDHDFEGITLVREEAIP